MRGNSKTAQGWEHRHAPKMPFLWTDDPAGDGAYNLAGLISELKAVGLAESAHDGGGVLVLGVHGVVEAANVLGGEFAGKIGERGAKLGKLLESGLPDNGDGVVGREVVKVIDEGDEAEGVDKAVGGIAGDDVNLMIEEGAIDEAEVHDFGGFGKAEMVAGAEAGEAVGALEKFVADAGAPFGGERGDVGERLEVEIFGVVTADDHGEGVFEAEWLGDFQVEAVGVELLHAGEDGGGVIAGRRFFEDGGEGGAGVFNVEIEFAGEESFVDEEGAA